MKIQKRTALMFMIAVSLFIKKNEAVAQPIEQTQQESNRRAYVSLSTMLTLDNSSSIVFSNPYNSVIDSTEVTKPKIKLLPDHLGNMEKVFWSENGIFRTTGIASLTPPERKIELTVRRTMLTAHQIGGFTTLALFIPTLIYGQRNINMRNAAAEGRGTFDQNLAHTHKLLGEWTFAAYMTTATLAIFSPPPLVRRDEWSTISTHKTLALIHFTGMVALPILGYLAFHAPTYEREKKLQQAHQITAYVTAAAFTASMIIITF